MLRGTGDVAQSSDPPTGLFSGFLRDATRDFQRKNRLDVDGIVTPEGETLATLEEEDRRARCRDLATEARNPRLTAQDPGSESEELSGLQDGLHEEIDRRVSMSGVIAWRTSLNAQKQSLMICRASRRSALHFGINSAPWTVFRASYRHRSPANTNPAKEKLRLPQSGGGQAAADLRQKVIDCHTCVSRTDQHHVGSEIVPGDLVAFSEASTILPHRHPVSLSASEKKVV